jgi:hypothetical protein
MILPVFTLLLEPENPCQFSLAGLRSFFRKKSEHYTSVHQQSAALCIHRYPVIQCKWIKNRILVIGIGQGAGLLKETSGNGENIIAGTERCILRGGDQDIRHESFCMSDKTHSYEFLTPWLALNQQNARKFYNLKGKQERDAFMRKILAGNLNTLAKSLDYDLPAALMCVSRVRFRRERIQDENVMVFVGSFETNLKIPDYLGIGQSISQGYGTIRSVSGNPEKEGMQP